MLKVGIRTYHRTVNESSIMQAYCLQKILKTLRPEAHIEIIDLRSLDVEKKELLKCFRRYPPFINMSQWKKRIKLRAFLRSHTMLSQKTCVTDNLEKASRFISNQNYHIIVVGSDTVWRIRSENGRMNIPGIYYLPGIHATRKIAFAVSLDMTNRALLNESRKRRIYNLTQDFNFISVRDKMSWKYLKEFGLCNKEISFMPDPTLLWDFSDLIQIPDDFSNDFLMAGVAVPNEFIRKKVTNTLKEKGYSVVNLLGPAVEGQITINKNYSFQKRLGIYRFLKLMVTDRFHSSIFTFKLGDVPVIFLENADKYPADVMSKGRDLFHRLGIEWSVYRHSKESFDSRMIDKMLNDWDKIKPDIKRGLNRLKFDAAAHLGKIF